jgi:hypothetical protein
MRRLYKRFKDARGDDWVCWLTDQPITHDGDVCRGITDTGKRTIWITTLEHTTIRAVHRTFAHEIVHAACGDTAVHVSLPHGAEYNLNFHGEENTCLRAEAGLVAIFESMGFEFPPLPRDMRLAAE